MRDMPRPFPPLSYLSLCCKWRPTDLHPPSHPCAGMSYKYHERAIVFNEKNLLRMWDVAYDGYCGGKECSFLNWGREEDIRRFHQADSHLNRNYDGPSCICIPAPVMQACPSPLPLGNISSQHYVANANALASADIFVQDIHHIVSRIEDKVSSEHAPMLMDNISVMYELLGMNRNNAAPKDACGATLENEATSLRFAYQGSFQYTKVSRWPRAVICVCTCSPARCLHCLGLTLDWFGAARRISASTTTGACATWSRSTAAGTTAPTLWGRPRSETGRGSGWRPSRSRHASCKACVLNTAPVTKIAPGRACTLRFSWPSLIKNQDPTHRAQV